MKICRYQDGDEKIWDQFVEQDGMGGTFLQTRRFLNYHPAGRFVDTSLLFQDGNGRILAVCPACVIYEAGKKIFFSHRGSTFGGLIISGKYYKAFHVLEIIERLREYLRRESFDEAYLKITPDLFSEESSELLQYCLQRQGFREYKELNTYIDFASYKNEILSNFSQGKRTNVNHCLKEGLQFREIDGWEAVQAFYEILCENLTKYRTKPVHTCEELIDLKSNRLKKEMEFFGVYHKSEMIAGGMVFYFQRVGVAHTQYLAAKREWSKLSPATFLYYSIIQKMRERGLKKVSWGIVTEDRGETLNEGLLRSKENYGSKYALNRTYFWRTERPGE